MNFDAHEKGEPGGEDHQDGEQADQKRCEVCGAPLPRRQGRGRPARYCTDSASCRSKASRARRREAHAGDEQLLAALQAVAPMRQGLADEMVPGPLQRVAALGEALGGAAYHYAATVQADGASDRALERLRQAVDLFSGRLLEAAAQAHRDALANPPISERAENGPAANPLPGPAISERAENGAVPRLVPPRPGGPGGRPAPEPAPVPDGDGLAEPPISTRDENNAPTAPAISERAENQAVPRLVPPRPGGPGGRPVPAPAPVPDAPAPHSLVLLPIGRRGLGPTTYASALTEAGPGWEIRGWDDQEHLCLVAHRGRIVGWTEYGVGGEAGWVAVVGLGSPPPYLVDAQDRPIRRAGARLAARDIALALTRMPAPDPA
ncbi:hypothetical protein ACFVT9_33815 [Kitasatospora cineracea]|uniref:hypothetical protein n=1 Tax=Kitasatospora cineracea TaxID=88074 RepID=UPI0036DA48C2